MNENKFSQKMVEKSDELLTYYIQNKGMFSEGEVQAAQWELEKRGMNQVIEDAHEAEVQALEEPTTFPEKPLEEPAQQSLRRSLISVALFIVAFNFLLGWSMTYILILVGVLLIHELGHYIAMRRFNYKDLGIFFIPLVGAIATGTKESISQKQSVIISLAGPLPGVLIGVILYYFGLQGENEFLIKTSNIFILLNLFNLLPIMPLDGGRVMKSLFFESNDSISLIFILISIGLMIYISISMESYFLLIIPFFLYLQIGLKTQAKKVRAAIQKKDLPLDKNFDELTDREYWLMRDVLAENIQHYSRFITPQEHTVSDKEQQVIKQIKGLLQKQPIKDLTVGGKILITVIWALTFVVPIVIIALYYIGMGIEL